jgi:hypothetical protein
MTDTNTMINYDDMSKEQLIEIIKKYNGFDNQLLRHKDKYFLINYNDLDYSRSSETCGSEHPVGEKVYVSKGRNDPRRFIGTVADMTKLTKEQLLEAINDSW